MKLQKKNQLICAKTETDWGVLLGLLSKWHILSKFQISKELIKLSGPVDNIDKGHRALEKMVQRVKKSQQLRIKSQMASNGPCAGSKWSHSTQSSTHMSQAFKLRPLHPENDQDVIELWSDYLIPSLPEILTRYLGSQCTAALVRQESPDGKSIVTISIESPVGQSSSAREHIVCKIDQISTTILGKKIHIHFSEGRVQHLAGEVAPPQSPPNDHDPFPHHRRYWRSPGMGASIGLTACNNVTATMGGYLTLGPTNYMLTTKHFIDMTGVQEPGAEVTSPSLVDVEEMKVLIDRKILQLCQNSASECETDEILLAAVSKVLFSRSEYEVYEQFKKEHSLSEDKYIFGNVLWKCPDQAIKSCNQHSNSSKSTTRCRMDWSLIKVKEDYRMGKNQHRHEHPTLLSSVDFEREREDHFGSGPPCTAADYVRPNDRVYYIGASGRQEGEINPSPIIEVNGDKTLCEWGMMIDGGIPDCTGDSGAWIVRQSDNCVIGLLWGSYNHHIIFTPIMDVIAHISSVTSHDTVKVSCDPSTPSSDFFDISLAKVTKPVTSQVPLRSFESAKSLLSCSLELMKVNTTNPPMSISTLLTIGRETGPHGLPKVANQSPTR